MLKKKRKYGAGRSLGGKRGRALRINGLQVGKE